MDTGQGQRPSNNTVKTKATTTVSRHTNLLEDRHVLLNSVTLRVDALGADALLELNGLVNTLATGQHFLSTDEHVESVGNTDAVSNSGASIVKLSIERTGSLGELVNDVEVSVVLLADDFAEGLLLGSAHILVVGDVGELGGAFLSEKLLCFGEGQSDLLARLGKKERFRMVNGSDGFDLGRASLCIDHLITLDGLERLLHLGLDNNKTLGVDVGNPLHHAAADNGFLLRGHNNTLDVPVTSLAELDKAHLGTLHTRVLEPSTDDNGLSIVGFVEGADFDFLGVLAEVGGSNLLVSVVVLGGVILEAEFGGSLLGSELSSALSLESLLLGLGLGLLETLLRRGSSVVGRRDLRWGGSFVGHIDFVFGGSNDTGRGNGGAAMKQ
ncbi:hypothetical protein HG530_000401 [Fusarium avenaceum]|nr:hypothetical protein HG530_000401 [Fusarium avenaceum]